MDKNIPRLHFHRFEFKYLISGDILKRVKQELSLRMKRDSHSEEDGSYFIRSIYFDTDALCWHSEKKAGLSERYKYRIRTYSSSRMFIDPVFLELKGRTDALVYKHRQFLDAAALENSLSTGIGTLCGEIMNSNSANGVGRGFVFDVFRKRLSPSTVVDYRRTAFENHANPDFRATIDHEVTSFRAGEDGHPKGFSSNITPGFDVLEIKFRYHLPAWFHRLICECELKRISFSKFELATEAAYINDQAARLNRILERRTACLL